MASPDSELVTAAKPGSKGGVSYAAPVGSKLPTDVKSVLDVAYIKHGYISDDGLTNTVETDSNDTTAFGGDTVLTVVTSRKETFSLTFIQSLDVDVQKEVYGQDNVKVDATPGITMIRHNNKDLPHRVFVFELLMTGDKVKRIVVPQGKVTDVGDVVYVDGDPVGYEVTITAFPSTEFEGDTAREYLGKLA
ncbi:MAG: hypothetical protein L0L18_12030 [Acidipropionibacterium jensenii]|nr:hypothetical protein [Acidipropionibacterium jensenii]